MTFRRLRDGLWLGLNTAVALVFLALSSSQWREPELRGDPSVATAGPGIVFMLTLFWIVGPLLLLNLAWLVRAGWTSLPRRDWTPVCRFAGMAAGWIGLIQFSASRV